jgi:hypothetical protein
MAKLDNSLQKSLLKTSSSEALKPNILNEDTESIYIGLLQLTGKIIDNFDIKMCERLVE